MMQASLALRARAQIASDRTLHGSSSSSAPARRPVAALASAREAASGRHASLRFARRRASRISAAPGDGKSLVYPETEAPPPDCKVGFDDGYVLVSEDSSDLLKEIERLKRENAEMEAAINSGQPQKAGKYVASSAQAGPPPTADTAAAAVVDVTALGTEEGDAQAKIMDKLSSAIATDEEVEKAEKLYSVVFVTSEVEPWSKTGGLGDVAGALPPALAKRGHRVMVVAPRYYNEVTAPLYAGAFDTNVRIKIACFGGEHEVGFFHQYKDGVDWVFVDHLSYQRLGNPYGDHNGAFGDNLYRYTLLNHAACEAPLVLGLGGFPYGQNVTFIANDWHAGLVPPLIASKYRVHGVYKDARVIFAVHNLLHQGVEPIHNYQYLGLPPDWVGALMWVYPEHMRAHALDKGETVNFLKGAIVTCDRVVTVSSNYAYEITTPEGGCGLDEVLRTRMGKLNGIVNGIDLEEWNPKTDTKIPHPYDMATLDEKKKNKQALQRELGLPEWDVPLIGFIGRLDWQKGPELVLNALDRLMQMNVQVIMLGSGRPDLEEWLKWAEGAHRERFRGWVGFSVAVSHRITAGCDILLMPSRFEPCGLNQLYAMRYGTVPVVHATGGLKDTVKPYSDITEGVEGIGTGFLFSPPDVDNMMAALTAATRVYKEKPERWRLLQRSCMRQDFSWNKAAVQYEQLFEWSKIDPPYCASHEMWRHA